MKFILMSALIMLGPITSVWAGNGGVNGGDVACEDRFHIVRDDIESWINRGGAAGLTLPAGVTLNSYKNEMLKYISDSADLPGHPFKAIVNCISDKIFVNGVEKTCRNENDFTNGKATIECNTDRFSKTSESDQYVLVHHEYAGLAGFEVNDGQESSYILSNQIAGFLTDQVVKKLAIVPPTQPSNPSLKAYRDLFNSASPLNLDSWQDGDFIFLNLEENKEEEGWPVYLPSGSRDVGTIIYLGTSKNMPFPRFNLGIIIDGIMDAQRQTKCRTFETWDSCFNQVDGGASYRNGLIDGSTAVVKEGGEERSYSGSQRYTLRMKNDLFIILVEQQDSNGQWKELGYNWANWITQRLQ